MNYRAPKPFLISSIIIFLIGALTLLKLPCPVDGGTGILKAAKNITVESMERTLVSTKDAFTFSECGEPVKITKYTYSIDMLLKNHSMETSQGIVLVKFFNPKAPVMYDELGQVVNLPVPTLPAVVKVSAGAADTINIVLSFEDLPLEAKGDLHDVTVEATRDGKDPTCQGTGRLSFVKWLEVKVLR